MYAYEGLLQEPIRRAHLIDTAILSPSCATTSNKCLKCKRIHNKTVLPLQIFIYLLLMYATAIM